MKRRDRFRGQLERLESAGGPDRAIEAGFYVERPGSSERLVRRIELKPQATRVIAGPIGSGKSTELIALADALNQMPDLSAIVIDVSLVHDLSDLQEGSLIAAAGVSLQSGLPTAGAQNVALRKVREIAYGTRETVGPYVKDAANTSSWAAEQSSVYRGSPGVGSGVGPGVGVLRPPNEGPVQELAKRLQQAVSEAVPELSQGTPILIFDSIDRVRDIEGFRIVLERDAAALVEHGFGVILTAPVRTLWSHSAELRSLCESWDTVPYVDPDRDPRAHDFLLQVLQRRADPDLLATQHQATLVLASGGVLRDLIELARNAVEEAYMGGRDAVTDEDAQASIARFARGLTLGLSSKDIGVLLSVRASQQVEALDEATLRLLENRQIIEHHDPASGSYFEPHPTLQLVLTRWA
jgi:hypothetical protein